MTLNTHAPFDKRDIWIDTFDCGAFQLDPDGVICRMNMLHAQFFHQLGEVLARPDMRGVEVLLVGDHSPVILDRGVYKKYVVDGMVPQIHLRTKSHVDMVNAVENAVRR